VCIDTQIKHRADEHVAADAGKDVEVESFHASFCEPCASALIWLAA
jgi:hypothetical protein